MKVKFTLTGDKQLNRSLEGVKTGVKNRIVKNAAAKLARAGAKRAKQMAPKGPTRALKKSIGSVYKSYQGRAVWVYLIGPRRDYSVTDDEGYTHDPAKIAHIVEGGRKAVEGDPFGGLSIRLKKGTIIRRRARAATGRRFMDKAWQEVQSKGFGQLKKDIIAAIKAEAKKQRRKGKSIYEKYTGT